MCTPTKTISFDDFWLAAEEKGCVKAKNSKGVFIGDPPSSTNYPHIHVWENGQIALSVGASKNEKIGKDEEIDIEKLQLAFDRFSVIDGALKETIQWVLSSAS